MRRVMQVAHIYWNAAETLGGIESMLAEEVQAYPKELTCCIILLGDCSEIFRSRIPNHIKVFSLGRKSGSGILGSILPILRLNLLIFKLSPLILVFHALDLAKFVFLGKYRIGRAHNVSTPVRDIDNDSFHKIIAISNAVKEYLLVNSKITSDRIAVIYNGIAVSRFIKKTLRPLENDHRLKIVHVARVDISVKAQDFALKALARLKDSLKWEYTLIGGGPDIPKLKELASDYNISDCLVVKGQISKDELYHQLKEYDVLILPSYKEGFGNVIVEAMAAKVPVLCSNIDGPKEIIEISKGGLCFESRNEHDFIEKIEFLFENYGGDQMRTMVESGYRFAQERCEINSMVRALLDEYFSKQK